MDERICIEELQAWQRPPPFVTSLPAGRLGRGGPDCPHPDPAGLDTGAYWRTGLGRAGLRKEWPDRPYEAGRIVAGNQVAGTGHFDSTGIRNAPYHLSH